MEDHKKYWRVQTNKHQTVLYKKRDCHPCQHNSFAAKYQIVGKMNSRLHTMKGQQQH